MENRTTESDSLYRHLEQMSTLDILNHINTEDQKVPLAIKGVIPRIESLVDAIASRMEQGGRLFYTGAGTSGRLGIVDASECPPTFGVPHGMVIGIIAGGDEAIRKAVEFAEDDTVQGWKDIEAFHPSALDTVIGIAASGSTPYVIGAVSRAREAGLLTGCITCNTGSKLADAVEHPIEVVVGPEFLTGSTRMKSGTAQKLVLNMISNSVMIRLGRVKDNKMVDMTPTNDKLIHRGIRMIMEHRNISESEAKALLEKYGSVRKALDSEN